MTAADYQLDYNGAVVIGDSTAWEVLSWGGLEEFSARNNDLVIPNGWGALAGSSYVNPKVVVVTVESVNPTDVLLLEAALLPPANATPDTLVPIRWKFPNREELRAMGRCARRVRARDVRAVAGSTRLTFQLEMPDPRAYSAAILSGSVPAFVAGTAGFDLTAGAGADLGFDLTAGAAADLGFDLSGAAGAGLFVAVNNGTVDTYPVLYFSAPAGMSAFSVTNQTTGQTVSFNQTVNVGETMTADMQAAATGVNAAGVATVPVSIGGVSRYGSWTAPRIPLRLVPGSNTLRFDVSAGDQNATCLAVWASAYL